jgi:hypothetical protein
MKPEHQAGLFFFGFFAVVCALSLFLPIVQEGRASSGLSGALGLPAWALAGGASVICTAVCVNILYVSRRDKK